MIDWQRGGWTGSLNRWVRREVREQLSDNRAARRVRYSLVHRALRRFFSIGTFGNFAGLYLLVALAFVAAEALSAWLVPDWLPVWTASGSAPNPDIKSLLLNVSSYLVSTQVGMLGVISLALALVTLIAQREGSSTDVQVYYHESLAFELVASCMALLAVLCAQLLWPLQFLLHRFGLGTDLLVFKLGLLGLHLGWLLLNLGAVAYFILTTFRFVQQSARELLRERYTVNVVQPIDMTQRLRHYLYGAATKELLGGDDDDGQSQRPSATFGFDFGDPRTIEIETTFVRRSELHDVRMAWVGWVLRRWSARCVNAAVAKPAPAGLRDQAPQLWFTPHIGEPLHGTVGWCRRRDGVPLTAIEKFVLRRAFRFRRSDREA
jgi:hypothetical protein